VTPEAAGGAPQPPDQDGAAAEDAEDRAEIDDGAESLPAATEGRTIKHPLDGWTKQQIKQALTKDPASLGSMSIGMTNAGALVNAVRMPDGDRWILVDPDHAWGTTETVDNLARCIATVNARFPGTPKLHIGHISARRGGNLWPHVSHQAGRDADVGYYYTGEGRWYATARTGNLDRARTWALVRAFVTDTDVDLILIDRSVQLLLKQYALSIGEDRAWLDQLFERSEGVRPVIVHAKGHATHIHVRFYSPIAQETARRTYDLLIAQHIIEPPSYYVRHRVKPGETLGMIAKKYGTTANVIKQANGLKSSVIRASQEYKIPRRGQARPPSRPVLVPARRLPPGAAAPASVPSAGDNVGISPVT
jgi:penicillin-insensitive murein endopeptidase